MDIAILGASGYTGAALLQRTLTHPDIKTIYASSRSLKNTPIDILQIKTSEKLSSLLYIDPKEVLQLCKDKKIDTVFSALPHGISMDYCNSILETNKDIVVIDLSADFRFKDASRYEALYKKPHINKKLLSRAVYGLSEWNREKISRAGLIACPGCYPTSVLLPLLPVIRYCNPTGLISIVSSSGISGAGKKVEPHLLFCERNQSVFPYSLGTQHRHVEEMIYYLHDIGNTEYNISENIVFSAQLVPISRGMMSIITIPLEEQDIPRAVESLTSQYIDEPFIHIHKENLGPDTATVQSTNYAAIGYRKEKNCLIVCCAIDNLEKGASGQAIQNFNIRFGFAETSGLI